MDLEIDRELWARGGHNGASALMNSDGKMCCLGFAAIQAGLSEGEITGVGEFSDLDQESVPHLQSMEFNPFCTIGSEEEDDGHFSQIHSTDFHNKAVDINDFKIRGGVRRFNVDGEPVRRNISFLTETDRELQLVELFKGVGITLTFTGEQHYEQANSPAE